jgi:hypothetical protein
MATRNRLRERRTDETLPYQLVYRFSGGSVFSTVLWGTYSRFSMAETFYDQYEAPKPGYAFPDHSCRHERIRGQTKNIGTWETTPLTGGFEPDRRWIVTEVDVSGCVPLVPPVVLDNIAYSAMKSFITDINEEGSLLNFIYELKDFGPLIGAISGLFSRILSFVGKPGLTWEFALKPLIEDAQKFVGLFAKVKKKLEFLAKFDGQETILNYNDKHVEDHFEWESNFSDPNEYGGYGFPPIGYCRITNLDITVRCHARVQIRCRGIKDTLRHLDAYMKAFGVASIIQWAIAIYKGIPFSWLFDFIFRTNRILDKLQTSVFGEFGQSPITVLSTTHSVRTRAIVEIWGKKPQSNAEVVGSYSVHRFSRGPGLPYSQAGGSILRYHSLAENASMLAILLQILFPSIRWERYWKRIGRGRR